MTTLTFPWPAKQLFPNFKRSHHWSAYRKHCKMARNYGWAILLGDSVSTLTLIRAALPKDGKITLTIEAQPPMRRGSVPDEDNLKGALKHYLDGIADALGVDDARFRFSEMQWLPKQGDGKITISF